MFETERPEKPLVYMPSYDAILVPGPAFAPRTPPIMQNLAALAATLPGQPPKRRRPILAVIDLLQKRYSQQQKKKEDTLEGEETVADSEVSTEKSNTTSDSGTQDANVCVEESAVNQDLNESVNNQSNNISKSDNAKSADEATAKAPQLTRVYSLLENLMKSHPDVNDGFSYAFKYSVPKSQTKLDEVEVSVQQSLKNFPEIPDDPLHGFKSPIDYKKAQAKLDLILEDSTRTGGPFHLNTPGAFGPLLLNEYAQEQLKNKKSDSSETVESEVVDTTTNQENETKATKLILRPVAKAVAGPRGVAIASPIAKAVLRRGQNVEVDYDPDAVAIAGPGGRAHAHPEFSVDYVDSKESSK